MGTIVLSLDAELQWGFHDLSNPPRSRIERARSEWMHLIELLEAYSVPATWAVVGHLFLAECDGVHGDHAVPPGWFDRDPGTNLDRNPGWYGPDLISAIKDARVDHEIGSHGFSHVEIGRAELAPSIVRAELEASQRAAGTIGEALRSFVFPRNLVGNRAELAKAGFTCYRTRYPRRLDSTPIRLPRKAIETIRGSPAPIVKPRIDEHGLVALPPSIAIFAIEGVARDLLRPVQERPVLQRIERAITAVADTDGILHLWCHPNDLARPGGRERMRRVLQLIEAGRDQGVRVDTMGGVAERVRSGESAPVVSSDHSM